MAHECPVCGVVAPDGEHLAHHLAIVALTRGGDHETWLDEHASGWTGASPADLAGTVLQHAEAVEHDLVDRADDHDHDPLDPPRVPDGVRTDDVPTDGRPAGGRPTGGEPAGGRPAAGQSDRGRPSDARAPGDDETAAVLVEARELTRRMRNGAADVDEDGETDTDE